VHKRLEHRQELETVLAELQKLQETDRAALLMRALDECRMRRSLPRWRSRRQRPG